MKATSSSRLKAWRNMMVAATNAGLDSGLFTLNLSVTPPKEAITYRFEIDGISAVGSVRDAGFSELSIHVALWPTPEVERWVVCCNADFLAGDAFASGWIARSRRGSISTVGAWLQVSNRPHFCCRRHLLAHVESFDVQPRGYVDHGRFCL